jgi:hypothetical protein
VHSQKILCKKILKIFKKYKYKNLKINNNKKKIKIKGNNLGNRLKLYLVKTNLKQIKEK